jgi:hypothetical protein
LLLFPWLPLIPGSREDVNTIAKDALERYLSTKLGVRDVAKAAALLAPWKDLWGPDALGRLVARSLGARLAELEPDPRVHSEWFALAGLPRLETICALEGGLAWRAMRAKVEALLDARDFAGAGRTYAEFAQALPRELLLDAPGKEGGSRLRVRLDAVLERMEARLDGRAEDGAELLLLPPLPASFGDALRSHLVAWTAPKPAAAAPKELLRDAVQRFAEAHDVVYMAAPDGHTERGRKVYLFGHVPTVLEGGVVFALEAGKWDAVSLDQLLAMAKE